MKPPAYKVAVFLHCIGVDALKIFNGFQFDGPGDENDLANIAKSSTNSPWRTEQNLWKVRFQLQNSTGKQKHWC